MFISDTTSKSGNKPPVLSPKPNPDLLVKRFSFNKTSRGKPENDTISSTSSTSSSPAVDRSATSANNVVRKLSAEFEKPKIPTVSCKVTILIKISKRQ